jgi:hypothetical protein
MSIYEILNYLLIYLEKNMNKLTQIYNVYRGRFGV